MEELLCAALPQALRASSLGEGALACGGDGVAIRRIYRPNAGVFSLSFSRLSQNPRNPPGRIQGRGPRAPPWPGGGSREPFGRFPGAPLVTFPALGKSRPPAGAAPAGAEILSRRRQLDEIVGRYDLYTWPERTDDGKTHLSPSAQKGRGRSDAPSPRIQTKAAKRLAAFAPAGANSIGS